LPENVSSATIEKMYEVLYECIPPENYNIKSKPDLDCHIRAISSLHKFIKHPKALPKFLPTDEEMSKLQLVKLIECSDDRAYNAGVEFANYVMKSCRLVIPQELLDNDEQTYDIVKRHNELEQWEMIDQH